ncbi:ATP-binding protein [Streptomyces sp. 4N509B]|uniref:ATP-binding protein n=1 Tax=Streptomyces sp. 4N509B TaxID=3457413 RepID=UPI003FD17E45
MSAIRPSQAGGDHGRRPEAPEPRRQVRRLRLVGIPGTVSRAREFTRRALHDWGWLPAATEEQRAAAEDVLLVVSELVTNACLHAGGPEELCVGHTPKLIRVEVTDRGIGAPVLHPARRAGRPGGHGLFIVQRLCLDWGVLGETVGTGDVTRGGGKTVWAELASPLVD